MDRYTKPLLCAAIASLLSVSLSGCFTAAYNASHPANPGDSEYSKVVLRDVISALAVFPKGRHEQVPVAFLGKQHSYVVTSGGDDLIKIAKSPFARAIFLIQDGNQTRLSLTDNQFNGIIELYVSIRTSDVDDQNIARALGFSRLARVDPALPLDPNGFTPYRRYISIAGYLDNPVDLKNEPLIKPLTVSFWGPTGNAHPKTNRGVGHTGAVLLDIATSPLQAVGVIAGVTVFVAGCSLSKARCE